MESIDEPGKERAELDRKESMGEHGLVWKPDGDLYPGKERGCPSGGDWSSEVLSGSRQPDHRPCLMGTGRHDRAVPGWVRGPSASTHSTSQG